MNFVLGCFIKFDEVIGSCCFCKVLCLLLTAGSSLPPQLLIFCNQELKKLRLNLSTIITGNTSLHSIRKHGGSLYVRWCKCSVLKGCLYLTEWKGGMEWNGMATPTERATTTYTHSVCYFQPRNSKLVSQ